MFSKRSIAGGIFVSILLFFSSAPAIADDVAWLRKIIEESTGGRASVKEILPIQTWFFAPTVYRVTFSFQYSMPKGSVDTGEGSLYIPQKLEKYRDLKFPLHYQAGYSKDWKKNYKLAKAGIIIANPEKVAINPLALGPNKDVAMLHIVRSLPFVDDSKVGIEGGSAGGYVALMLAAESFPLSYVNTTGAVLNRGYNLTYLNHSIELTEDSVTALPVVAATAHVAEQASYLLTPDLTSISWYNSSPISQIDTITCPVAIRVSTADTLVPIDQVGRDLAVPVDERTFPAGFTSDLDVLAGNEKAKTSLLDLLKPRQYEIFRLEPPPGLPVFNQMEYDLEKNPPKSFSDMPFSEEKQWSIVIRDEGPMIPVIGHIKYLNFYIHTGFNDFYREEKIAPRQLTGRKLERLMSRYAGKSWLEDPFVALDTLESEKQDVLRGLVTYTKDPAAAERFLNLYRKLPLEQQVLEKNIRRTGPESVNSVLQRAYNKYFR